MMKQFRIGLLGISLVVCVFLLLVMGELGFCAHTSILPSCLIQIPDILETILLSIFFPLLVLSFLTIHLKKEVFLSWFRPAAVFIPAIIFSLIYINQTTKKGLFFIDLRPIGVIGLVIVFFSLSLSNIFFSYLKHHKNKTVKLWVRILSTIGTLAVIATAVIVWANIY